MQEKKSLEEVGNKSSLSSAGSRRGNASSHGNLK